MERKKNTKRATALTLIGVGLLFLVILLPLYYKMIWPPMIGEPASALTVDVLAFWGAVFSGIITLVGVYFTIRFSQKEIEQTHQQQVRDQFIKGFGATVLEINSITYETKKFRNYLQQLKTNLEVFSRTGEFSEIVVEFDTKDDYKKIRNQKKPDLEIICNRFEGKAAHADGYVYSQISHLSEAIKTFQRELHAAVDQLQDPTNENIIENYEFIFQQIYQSIAACDNSLKDYKMKLGERFKQYSDLEGYM